MPSGKRMGLVKSDQWQQLPAEGLFQFVIPEVLDDGKKYPLERNGRKALSITSMLDLRLIMTKSDRRRADAGQVSLGERGDHVQQRISDGRAGPAASCTWSTMAPSWPE
ncbi:hypothetical protein VTH06DRAFT_5694 [Thermothelomyces fergusii]